MEPNEYHNWLKCVIGPRYKKSCLIQIVNLDLLFFVKKGKR